MAGTVVGAAVVDGETAFPSPSPEGVVTGEDSSNFCLASSSFRFCNSARVNLDVAKDEEDELLAPPSRPAIGDILETPYSFIVFSNSPRLIKLMSSKPFDVDVVVVVEGCFVDAALSFDVVTSVDVFFGCRSGASETPEDVNPASNKAPESRLPFNDSKKSTVDGVATFDEVASGFAVITGVVDVAAIGSKDEKTLEKLDQSGAETGTALGEERLEDVVAEEATLAKGAGDEATPDVAVAGDKERPFKSAFVFAVVVSGVLKIPAKSEEALAGDDSEATGNIEVVAAVKKVDGESRPSDCKSSLNKSAAPAPAPTAGLFVAVVSTPFSPSPSVTSSNFTMPPPPPPATTFV